MSRVVLADADFLCDQVEGQDKRATLCLSVWSKKVCQYLNTYLHASSAETSETHA